MSVQSDIDGAMNRANQDWRAMYEAVAADLVKRKLNAQCEEIEIDKLRARVAALEPALRKCIETFDDMQRVLRLLNRPVLADACAVAADSSRDVLMPPQMRAV